MRSQNSFNLHAQSETWDIRLSVWTGFSSHLCHSYSDGNNLVDFTYVENVVHKHMLAEQHLGQGQVVMDRFVSEVVAVQSSMWVRVVLSCLFVLFLP